MRKSLLLGLLLSTRLFGQSCDPCTYPQALLCTQGKNPAKRSDWQDTGFYTRRFNDEKYHYMSYIPDHIAADATGEMSWGHIWPYAQVTLLIDDHADGTADAKYVIRVPAQRAKDFYNNTLKGILAQAKEKPEPLRFIDGEFKKLNAVDVRPVSEDDQKHYKKDVDAVVAEMCGNNY